MTKYNFNYEELGFESEEELQESIARVERRKNMSDVEEEIEYLNNRTIDSKGNIDFEAMNAGARLEYLDRLVQSKMYEAQQKASLQAEQEQIQGLMSGLSKQIDTDKKTKAQRELQEAKQKADAELQKEIFEKHGVKTDKQQADDEALRSMLKDL